MLVGESSYAKEYLWGSCLGGKWVVETSSNNSHINSQRNVDDMGDHSFSKYFLYLKLLNFLEQCL